MWNRSQHVQSRSCARATAASLHQRNLQRHQLAGSDQPAGMAQGAELEREAEAVVGTAASGDHRQVVGAERVVADEVGLGRRQGVEGVELGFGEDAAARHGEAVPVGVDCLGRNKPEEI